jgi:hypothetical protein
MGWHGGGKKKNRVCAPCALLMVSVERNKNSNPTRIKKKAHSTIQKRFINRLKKRVWSEMGRRDEGFQTRSWRMRSFGRFSNAPYILPLGVLFFVFYRDSQKKEREMQMSVEKRWKGGAGGCC